MPVDVTFEVSGAEDWIADLRYKQTHIVDQYQATFRSFGDKIADSAQKYVRANAYDTGSLHRSIDWLTYESRNTVRLEVGPMKDALDTEPGDKDATEYARYVHDGTSLMAPRPYMDIAYKKHARKLMKEMRSIARTIGPGGGGVRRTGGRVTPSGPRR